MISKTIANIAKRSRSIVINQSDMIPSEHNKRIDEMRKNNELYLSLRHSENFSKDTYLGIMKGELVASGHSSNRVSMALIEKYTEINEINENTVHVIPSPMKYSQHPSQELNMANLDWKEVAKPYHDELIEDGLVDRNFAKIRWVSKSMRPYCTFAVSNDLDSYFFPMTFFVHTGSSRNYIKKSLFHLINPGKITHDGEKILYIHGKPFKFSLAPSGMPTNINIIGTSALLILPKFAELFSTSLHGNSNNTFEEGRITFEDRIKE